MDFKDKVAIVTGAGQGIGLEICKQLVANGANVILNDLDAALTKEAVANLDGNEGNCIGLAGDSSDMQLIDKMVDTAVTEFGKLDVVVANAGITLFGEFLSYTPESFFEVMKVNLGGSFFSGPGGSQINEKARLWRVNSFYVFGNRASGT